MPHTNSKTPETALNPENGSGAECASSLPRRAEIFLGWGYAENLGLVPKHAWPQSEFIRYFSKLQSVELFYRVKNL
jgi:hypothetical protein